MSKKVAYVTGGMGGIGTAICQRLHKDGFTVIAGCGPTRDYAKWLAEQKAEGYEFHASVGNVGDWQSTVEAFTKAKSEHGTIDVLVNNAGVIRDNLLALLEVEDVKVVLDTNVGGVFNVTRAVVPHMIARRAGKIVNVSSVSGEKGGRGQTNYAASKGAVNALTRALAVELASRRINVNCVAPGVIETEMSQEVRERAGDEVRARILLRRFGAPQDVANAVWFLASKYADYITGQVLHVDGGFKME
jgi:acetoacetyl-CoA reductase